MEAVPIDLAGHRKRALPWESGLVVVLAAILGVWAHWAEFKDPNRFHNNWRQAPHWLSSEHQRFQPDDLLIRYANFNTSPFANLLYKTLAKTGQDILWGKVNAVLFFSVMACITFVTGKAIGGRIAGWAAVSIFLFFPIEFWIFVGGFMSGLSMPFLGLTVLVVTLQRWWWVVQLIAAEVFVYPMVALQTAAILILDVAYHDRLRLLSADLWKRKMIPLVLAAAVCCGGIGLKYLGEQHPFGTLADRVEIGKRPADFGSGSRAKLVPAYPVFRYVTGDLWGFFRGSLIIAAFLTLGKRMFRLPRGLGTLFVSSILMYWLAEILLMRLYFPTRYVWRSLPLFMILAGGWWVSRMWARERTIPPLWRNRVLNVRLAGLATVLLAAIGLLEYGDRLQPGHLPTNRFIKTDLYQAVRDLPGEPLLAAHPRLASEVLIMGGKSFLLTKELTHPWWSVYWAAITERTHEFFTAYYSDDPQQVLAITRKYGIDYWIIDRQNFSAKYLRKGDFHIAPFSNWVRRHAKPGRRSLLRDVPDEYRMYDDERFIIVSTPDLTRYINATARGAAAPDTAPGGAS